MICIADCEWMVTRPERFLLGFAGLLRALRKFRSAWPLVRGIPRASEAISGGRSHAWPRCHASYSRDVGVRVTFPSALQIHGESVPLQPTTDGPFHSPFRRSARGGAVWVRVFSRHHRPLGAAPLRSRVGQAPRRRFSQFLDAQSRLLPG